MSDTPKFPLTLPGGQLMPHMSSRARHIVADTVFEMLGGTERLHHEANRNSEAYWDFMKSIWAKGLPRAVATEPTANNEQVEEMLKRLDAADRATVINGSATRVHETDVVDVTEDDS